MCAHRLADTGVSVRRSIIDVFHSALLKGTLRGESNGGSGQDRTLNVLVLLLRKFGDPLEDEAVKKQIFSVFEALWFDPCPTPVRIEAPLLSPAPFMSPMSMQRCVCVRVCACV